MLEAVRVGRPNTAMKGFAGLLSDSEIRAVIEFIEMTFIAEKRTNSRYHTPANGWQDHERYRDAFPFALGQIPLDTPSQSLTAPQRRGKSIFMSSCITCHDRATVREAGVAWDARAVSYPRGGYEPGQSRKAPDSVSAATPYARYDQAPVFDDLDAEQARGEKLFQTNCAFCHGADGTARNWIGRFLDPHPRDLTALQDNRPDHLRQVIREGLPGTTMSAWKYVLTEPEIDAIIAYIKRAFVTDNR